MDEAVPDNVRRVIEHLARGAARARVDPAEFFSFVFRHEKTNAPLTVTPHQRLRFEFIAAHPLCVIRTPTGTSKTFDLQAYYLWLLGEDRSIRGAVISGKQEQAAKVVRTVSEYIDESPHVQLVFPGLKASTRDADPWTQTQITVERPVHSRDPSLVAVGYGGKLPGSRLTWVLIDDILNAENTATPEGRKKLNAWVHSTVLSRRGNEELRVVVTNVPWHPGVEADNSSGETDDVGDLTFALARLGWPVLNMDISGDVWFENTDWDTDLIRPSEKDNPAPTGDGRMHRLVEHDTPEYARLCGIDVPAGVTEWIDHDNQVPLWPEEKPWSVINEARSKTTLLAFEQTQMVRVRSDMSSLVKEAWIERCKQAATIWTPPIRSLYAGKWTEPFPTITGIDPAFSQKKKADQSAMFTFAVYPNGFHRILNVSFGKWSPNELIDKIIAELTRFNSIGYVESNGAQMALRHWALERKRNLTVRAVNTGKNKWDMSTGIESIFVELENAAWLIPNDAGTVDPNVAEAIRQALFYTRNRKQHTGDVLMSWWIAREGARKSGFLRPGVALAPNPTPGVTSGVTLNQILSR